LEFWTFSPLGFTEKKVQKWRWKNQYKQFQGENYWEIIEFATKVKGK